MNMSPNGSCLFIATPCYGGMVTQQYLFSVMSLLQHGNDSGLAMNLELLGYESLITRGRNTLVSRFLDNEAATHLLFIDADIGFDPEQVSRMMAFDRDVVAGMYPLKQIDWVNGLGRAHAGEPVETAALRYVGAPCRGEAARSRDGFVTADYAGTGFMLIRREVFLRMAEAYPNLRYAACHNSSQPSLSPNQYAFFDCMIEKDTGNYLSEDYTFCRRWRDLGGQIWLDTQGALTHVGAHDFVGAPSRRFAPAPVRESETLAA
jgi:hypothetical protein